ncbi:MAG: EAL domain-containing protein [Leptolyngbyaceae cyanobacterium]
MDNTHHASSSSNGCQYSTSSTLAFLLKANTDPGSLLSTSPGYLRQLFDQLELGIAVYEAAQGGEDFIFVDFNQTAERIDRAKREALIGQPVTQVFPGVVEFGLLDVLRRVWRTGQPEVLPATKYQDDRIGGWRENRVYRLPNGMVVAVYEDVTARVVAETASKACEQRYQLLTESSLDGVWDWYITQNRLYLSPKWKAQLGFEDDELPNTFATWRTRIHPSDRPQVLAHLHAFLNSPESLWQHEFRLRHKDGHYCWILARGTPVLGSDGKVERLLGVHIDITRDKQLLQQLANREAHYRQTLNATNTGTWEFEVATEKVFWSDRLESIWGLAPGAFRGDFDQVKSTIHPDDFDAWQADVQRCLSGQQDHDLDFRIRHPDGSIHWVHAHGVAIKDDQGHVVRLQGLTQDITGRKAAEQKLQQAATAFENTIEGVIITDLEGQILDVNRAFIKVTGYSKEESIGQNPRFLKSGRHDDVFYQQMWQSLTAAGEWRGEIWNQRKDGMIYPALLAISTVYDPNHQPSGYVGIFSDITSVKETEARLEYLAHHDPLTNLPNRLLFNAHLQKSILAATRKQTLLAVVFVDLDRFKHINDSLGHAVGDDLLKQLAQRLKQSVRASDTVARLGGDEFVLLLDDLTAPQQALVIVQKLLQKFQQPFLLNDQPTYMTCSLGISIFPQDGTDPMTLLRDADTAMYRAKESGRHTYCFYTEEMTKAVTEQLSLTNGLRHALERHEFYLVYQPQVDLSSGHLVGVEVLLRWQHPDLGTVSPACFIPLAEQTGYIHDLGAWVLREACQQGRQWLDQGLEFGRLAVNVSGAQIQRSDFVGTVQAALQESGLPAHHLELEVTENFVMKQVDCSIEQLTALKQMGIEISIDDFGTGYSSLSYLKRLPIAKLKIDQSFVQEIPHSPDDAAIAEAVIALSQALRLTVVAEGVETQAQADFLESRGCPIAQGYLYSKPVSARAIAPFLSSTSQKT